MQETVSEDIPRITFGIIVLNGEPFMQHCLRQLYEAAHEIIVVEGACPDARDIATSDGHSSDSTRATLAAFCRDEDPEGKVTVLTAEDLGHPDGFWPGEKDEMCAAWASRATGDYIWQIDADEFYHPDDLIKVARILAQDPAITMVQVPLIAFWGDFDYVLDGWYFRLGTRTTSHPAGWYRRVWRWGPGYSYSGHRPPTVVDAQGRALADGKVLGHRELARRGIFMHHYLGVFRQQVEDKLTYYSQATWKKNNPVPQPEQYHDLVWDHVERNPFRVHFIQEYPSWLSRFAGEHPPEIVRLRADLAADADGGTKSRRTDDLDRLLDSPWYRARRRYWVARTAVEPAFAPWRRRFETYLGSGREGYQAAWSRLRGGHARVR